PLPVWEAYLSSPFARLTFRFADGSSKEVERWEKVYYSWHCRMLALVFEDGSSVAYPADDIVAVSRMEPAPSHTNVLERLRWYKSAQLSSPICIRTKWGKAFLVEAPFFDVDHSGSILGIAYQTGM